MSCRLFKYVNNMPIRIQKMRQESIKFLIHSTCWSPYSTPNPHQTDIFSGLLWVALSFTIPANSKTSWYHPARHPRPVDMVKRTWEHRRYNGIFSIHQQRHREFSWLGNDGTTSQQGFGDQQMRSKIFAGQ